MDRIDDDLVRLSHNVAALRLRVGEALERLAVNGGHHELGFSSLEAYARERCERGGRWAADTRAMARRLSRLPLLREALSSGVVSWSMAEIMARHATPDDEREWLERARSMTVRAMRRYTAELAPVHDESTGDEFEVTRRLTVTANREDAWLFEAASRVAQGVGASNGALPTNEVLRALLAEGYSTLIELLPEERQGELREIENIERAVEREQSAQAAWCAELERWREHAENLCQPSALAGEEGESREPRASPLPPAANTSSGAEAGPAKIDSADRPRVLDREVRRLCRELVGRDLALGLLAERARAEDVWLRLGFASEAHYVRERLGCSLSSIKSRRLLAVRAQCLKPLTCALEAGLIGYEAACLVARVATPRTVEVWLERARERTVKHLREEVEVAELLVRFGHGRDQEPPDETARQTLLELERRVASGELFQDGQVSVGAAPGGQVSVKCAAGLPPAEPTIRVTCGVAPSSISVGSVEGSPVEIVRGQTSVDPTFAREPHAPPSIDERTWDRANATKSTASAATPLRNTSFGRVTYRWWVSDDTYRFWRALERVFVRVRTSICSGPVSFLHFLCENLCRIWAPFLHGEHLTEAGREPAYYSIYKRDVFRCTSPVCTRRDLTPHHLRYRSHGGGDEDENVTSLCVWCHLRGIHGGRLKAEPPASRIHWQIGRDAILHVDGRTRRAA